MTEHEANMKFCQFIRYNFGFEPKPISSHSLSSIRGKRAAVFIHNDQQAEILDYDLFFGDCVNRHYIVAPYYGYEDDEAFEYCDYNSIINPESFSRLQAEYDDWQDEDFDEDSDEENTLFADIAQYGAAYYIVTDCTSAIGIDEFI